MASRFKTTFTHHFNPLECFYGSQTIIYIWIVWTSSNCRSYHGFFVVGIKVCCVYDLPLVYFSCISQVFLRECVGVFRYRNVSFIIFLSIFLKFGVIIFSNALKHNFQVRMRRMTMNEQSTNNGQNISKEMVLSLFTIEISEFWPLKMFNVLKGICPQTVNFFFSLEMQCLAN